MASTHIYLLYADVRPGRWLSKKWVRKYSRSRTLGVRSSLQTLLTTALTYTSTPCETTVYTAVSISVYKFRRQEKNKLNVDLSTTREKLAKTFWVGLGGQHFFSLSPPCNLDYCRKTQNGGQWREGRVDIATRGYRRQNKNTKSVVQSAKGHQTTRDAPTAHRENKMQTSMGNKRRYRIYG